MDDRARVPKLQQVEWAIQAGVRTFRERDDADDDVGPGRHPVDVPELFRHWSRTANCAAEDRFVEEDLVLDWIVLGEDPLSCLANRRKVVDTVRIDLHSGQQRARMLPRLQKTWNPNISHGRNVHRPALRVRQLGKLSRESTAELPPDGPSQVLCHQEESIALLP
ncbi:hypothetical protein GCM10025787_38550 [Saccharopolyspora rosea]